MMCHVADAGMQSHNSRMLFLILNPFSTSQLSAPLIIIQFILGGKITQQPIDKSSDWTHSDGQGGRSQNWVTGSNPSIDSPLH